MLHFSIWYFVLTALFTNQLQHSISTFTRSSNDNRKSSPICLSTDSTEQFVFIFPCISGRKEMSHVHFVVTKFPHIGIDACSLNYNRSFNLYGSFDLNGSINLNRIDNTTFSITRIIIRILNHIYK